MDLMDPVDSLKGVGPKTAEILRKYGIKTVRDFVYNLPRDYENYDSPTSIAEMRPGKVVIRGKVSDLKTRRTRRRNLTITEGTVSDNSGSVRVVWFNQRYREHQFAPNTEYFFTGNFELRNGRYSLISPTTAETTYIDPRNGLNPIYVAHGGLKSNDFRRLMVKSRDIFVSIPDMLPTVQHGTRAKALFYAHFPNTLKSIQGAHDYLAYEELFELILASQLNRRENDKLQAMPLPFKAEKIRGLVSSLPFTLTGAQRRAAWDVFQDMERAVPMNRLLQGDVGSGKTMVAGMSAYEAFLGGAQVALLAPTAILASQHYEGLKQILGPLEMKIALLTGATKKKSELKLQIHRGEVDLVIGTHALLTDDTEFARLGLVIIDEQHRFGVEQRQKLMLKSPSGLAPHLLAMTATPIPRSLQLTVFGDLDVSILDEMPAGRQPVMTSILTEVETKEQLYPKMQQVLQSAPDKKRHGAKAHGQQIYWICKAIDDVADGKMSGAESSRAEITSVKKRSKRLQEVFRLW